MLNIAVPLYNAVQTAMGTLASPSHDQKLPLQGNRPTRPRIGITQIPR